MYWNDHETKNDIKNTINGYRYFLKAKLFKSEEVECQKVICQKELFGIIIIIINGKKFYDQPIDSNIKRFEEIENLQDKLKKQGKDKL